MGWDKHEQPTGYTIERTKSPSARTGKYLNLSMQSTSSARTVYTRGSVSESSAKGTNEALGSVHTHRYKSVHKHTHAELNEHSAASHVLTGVHRAGHDLDGLRQVLHHALVVHAHPPHFARTLGTAQMDSTDVTSHNGHGRRHLSNPTGVMRHLDGRTSSPPK